MAEFQGTPGADALTGTVEADTFYLQGGADAVRGGAGGDRFVLGAGDAADTFGSVLEGGDGYDVVDGSATSGNLRILSPISAGLGIPGITVTSIESIVGGAGQDVAVMLGEVADLSIDGAGGNDLLIGGWGNDLVSGGEGNDILSGAFGNDAVYGGAGNDILAEVKLGPDWGSVTLDGGDGTDWAVFGGISGEIDLAAGGGNLSGAAVTMTGIENVALIGPGHDFVLRGDESANVLGIFGLPRDLTTGATIEGRGGDDTLFGGRGNDVLSGGEGEDQLAGNRGMNLIDGGEGADTLVLSGRASDYTVLRHSESWLVRYQQSTDTVVNVEQVTFDGGSTTITMDDFFAASFNAYGYLASYADLRAAFGSDIDAARTHWESYGQTEERNPGLFDARTYGASHPDVAIAFGNDPHALAKHYIEYGIAEGRATSGFDPLTYGASYSDLARAFGADSEALLNHYLVWGASEGRATNSFNPWVYAASNSDVALAFGANSDLIRSHYLTYGANEGRSTDSFAALDYAALNPDVARAFGDNTEALARHYVEYGQYEGRPTSGFDPVAYLLSQPELADQGFDAKDALQYWVVSGVHQSEDGESLFGREQASHLLSDEVDATGAIETANDRDWFSIDVGAGETFKFEARATDGSGRELALSLYNEHGQMLSSDTDGQLTYSTAEAEHLYVVAMAADDEPVQSYSIDALHLI